MAQDQTRDKKNYEAYTVAVVCAIEFEMSAVRYMLDEEHQRLPSQPGDPNRYILGQLSGHDTVLAWLPGVQGKSAAATVAVNLDRTFPSIRWRFLTGIGGGVPEYNDVRLGDVAVSMPAGRHGGLVQYDLGKDLDGGFVLKGFLSAPPAEIRGAVLEMKSDHRVNDNRIEEFVSAMLQKSSGLDDYRRPPSESDLLFVEDYQHITNNRDTCEDCDPDRLIRRPDRSRGGSKIHYGLIASGDRVMRSAVKRNLEVERLGKEILCFEMEAAGLSTEFPYLVIRGISDYADSHKNDAWQYYAAAAAAACTKEILAYLDPAPASPAALAVPAITSPADDCGSGSGTRASFSGSGIQNLGSFSVGRDMSISGR
ncbi:nucleoside phosphorylase domain-containing protein [Xylaria venustula]|nr:nucleoside phosphorylase domain-containing protein [Xylaria venustula]